MNTHLQRRSIHERPCLYCPSLSCRPPEFHLYLSSFVHDLPLSPYCLVLLLCSVPVPVSASASVHTPCLPIPVILSSSVSLSRFPYVLLYPISLYHQSRLDAAAHTCVRLHLLRFSLVCMLFILYGHYLQCYRGAVFPSISFIRIRSLAFLFGYALHLDLSLRVIHSLQVHFHSHSRSWLCSSCMTLLLLILYSGSRSRYLLLPVRFFHALLVTKLEAVFRFVFSVPDRKSVV